MVRGLFAVAERGGFYYSHGEKVTEGVKLGASKGGESHRRETATPRKKRVSLCQKKGQRERAPHPDHFNDRKGDSGSPKFPKEREKKGARVLLAAWGEQKSPGHEKKPSEKKT